MSPRPQLHPAATRLFAYGATSTLSVAGKCLCKVELDSGQSRNLLFYVLSSSVDAEPLLGLQACDQLNLLKRVAATTVSPLVSEPVSEPIPQDSVAGQYMDLFQGFGCMREYSYQIQLKEGAQPHCQATARKVPYNLYDKVKAELERMLQLNVIKEVVQLTAWVSPMVVVPKKDGSVRICVDYTKLNRSVKRERFQLPLAEDIFAKLRGAKFFTILDAASGFWQIPLTDGSELTTFITHSVVPIHAAIIRYLFGARSIPPGSAARFAESKGSGLLHR